MPVPKNEAALRAVADDERRPEPPTPPTPPTLMDAVESGDVLAIMKAQRRIIAQSLATAADNTRPQFSNELNKLNALIAAEEAKRALDDEHRDSAATATPSRSGWDQAAI